MSYSSGYSSSGEVSTSSSSSTDEMFSVNMADVPLIQMATGFIEEPKGGMGLKDTLEDGYYEEEDDESRMGNSSTASTPKGRDAGDGDGEQDQMDERSEFSEDIGQTLMNDSSKDHEGELEEALQSVEREAGGDDATKVKKSKAKKKSKAAKEENVMVKSWIGVFESMKEVEEDEEETKLSPQGKVLKRLQEDSVPAPLKRTIEGSPMPIRAKRSTGRDAINRDQVASGSPAYAFRSPRDDLAVKELPEPRPLEGGVKAALKRTLSPKNLLDRLSPRKREKETPERSAGAQGLPRARTSAEGKAEAPEESPVMDSAVATVAQAPAAEASAGSPPASPSEEPRQLDAVPEANPEEAAAPLPIGGDAGDQEKSVKRSSDTVQNESSSDLAARPSSESQLAPVARRDTDDKAARRKRRKEKKEKREARAKRKEGKKKEKDGSRKKKREKSKRKHRRTEATEQEAPTSEAADDRPKPDAVTAVLAMGTGPHARPSPQLSRERTPVAEEEEQMPLTGRGARSEDGSEPSSAAVAEKSAAASDAFDSVAANGILDLAFQHLEEIEQQDVEQFLSAVDKREISAVNLSYNALKDVPSFADLPNLVRLSLAGNCLMEIPKTVQSLSKLQVLDLRYNKLVRLPPEVSNLPHLLTLLLNNNNLQVIPRNVGFLRQLRFLDVSNNVICRLPRSTQELVELRVLNCRDNELVKLPNLGRLTNLTHLDCSGNMINALPYDFNGAIQPFVSMVRLADNVFRSVPMQNLERFRKLEYLDMDGNNIEMLPPSVRALTSVKCLFLSRNKISFMSPEIGALSSLYRLHIDHNRLTELPDSFKNLGALRELSLCYNQFTEIPPVLTTLHLLSLKISSNVIEVFPENVGELVSLDTLDLSDNVIRKLPPSIGNLSKLVTLSLECNRLTEVPEALTDCTRLTLLNLAQNEIEVLPEVGSLQQLQDFILWDNKLEDMPDSICLITTFHSLQVTGNPMTNIPEYCHAGGSELWTYLYQRNLKVDDGL